MDNFRNYWQYLLIKGMCAFQEVLAWHHIRRQVTKMYTSYLKILKFHLRSCKFVKCLPFEFAKNSGRIVLTRNLGRIRMFRFQCVLSVIYTGAMFVNICFGWLTLTEKFQGIVFFSLFFIACIHRWNWNLDITGIQVINSFLEFEEVVLKGRLTRI